MIIPVKQNGKALLAITLPSGWDRSCIRTLRDSLMDMLITCVESEDAKDATASKSMYYSAVFIEELTKEIEEPK